MAMSLQELQAQLSGLDGYTRKTDEELRAQAEGLYKNQYDQNLKMLTDSINQSVADQNRSALGSGMQRSSYNQAAQASILNQGVESRQKLAADYETNVANALYQLMAKEDEKELQANQQKNQLLMALYEYGQAAKRRSSGTTKTTPNPLDLNGDGVVDDKDIQLYNQTNNNRFNELMGGSKTGITLNSVVGNAVGSAVRNASRAIINAGSAVAKGQKEHLFDKMLTKEK